MTRAGTMVLALVVLHALLGGLCLVVARGERRAPALSLWGAGLLIYAGGLLVTLASFLPIAVSKVVGNGLIAYSPIPAVEGALHHTRTRLAPRWLTIAFLATMAPIVGNHLRPSYSVIVDLLAPAPLANVLFVLGAVALVREATPAARPAARFLAGIFLFAVLVWSLRMLVLWLSVGGSNDRERADLTIALFVIAQLVIAVALTLGLLWIEVREMAAELERIAYTDALTGLPNRRATLERFREEAARAEREQRRLALIVFDVDHFKRINDGAGHLTGDAVLRHVAARLAEDRRAGDVIGRVGGEEFVLILSDPSTGDPLRTAERLREGVATSPLEIDGHPLGVTISGGLALGPNDGRDWDSLFAAADRRLYDAKAGGRNRVVGPTPEP